MSHYDQRSENAYIVDVESATEIVRLMNQDGLVTRAMGGLFPERTDLSDIGHILDVACGPGGWVLDVAFAYPKVEVIGIDISQTMVEHARTQAWVRGMDNAHFMIMDALKPLDFPDQRFDMINARFLAVALFPTAWPGLLRECVRLLRPGGVLRLTEAEVALTTGAACEKLSTLCIHALHRAGRCFSPDGRNLGITPMLGHFLRQAGCQKIGYHAHFLDYSVGTNEHWNMSHNINMLQELLRPFLLKEGVISEEELDHLQREATVEMLSDDFCAGWWYLTAWGVKP